MINFVLITVILVLMPMPITISHVNAGGPRLDYDERYEDVPGAPECWVDGYDAGFAGDYDRNRADECKDIPGDQYNRSWPYGCKDGGLTEGECNEIKSDPDDNINHESLQEENRGTVMMMVMRTAKIVILLIMIETVDVPSTAIHTKLDSRQAVNQ